MPVEPLKCPERGAGIRPDGEYFVCDYCGVRLKDQGAGLEAISLVCPECKSYNLLGERFCGRCGYDLYKVLYRTCRYCGAVVHRGRRFCSGCGRDISVAITEKIIHADNMLAVICLELQERREAAESILEKRRKALTAAAPGAKTADQGEPDRRGDAIAELARAADELRGALETAEKKMSEVNAFINEESRVLKLNLADYLRHFAGGTQKVRTEIPYVAIGTELRAARKTLRAFEKLSKCEGA